MDDVLGDALDFSGAAQELSPIAGELMEFGYGSESDLVKRTAEVGIALEKGDLKRTQEIAEEINRAAAGEFERLSESGGDMQFASNGPLPQPVGKLLVVAGLKEKY